MQTTQEDNLKIINCRCREWTIRHTDLEETKIPDNYYLLHECESIKVFQERKGINRLFIKK